MIRIGEPPSSDFTDPLGLLSDCHRRIERFLNQLIVAAEQSQEGNLTPDARAWLDQALRYFEKAAPLHTRDEEESLFPRLRALDDPAALAALEMMEALEADHQAADQNHGEVHRLGKQWLETGRLSAGELRRMLTLLHNLRDMYEKHIAVEDQKVFPLAGKLLDAAAIRELGREMARRRDLDPDSTAGIPHCVARKASARNQTSLPLVEHRK